MWRGPSIIINAGCLTSRTVIPKGVFPLFITMENDYFSSVNKIEKVINLFYNYIENPSQKAVFLHLKLSREMPVPESHGTAPRWSISFSKETI